VFWETGISQLPLCGVPGNRGQHAHVMRGSRGEMRSVANLPAKTKDQAHLVFGDVNGVYGPRQTGWEQSSPYDFTPGGSRFHQLQM